MSLFLRESHVEDLINEHLRDQGWNVTDEWRGTVRSSLETLEDERLDTGEEAATVPALCSVRVCAPDFSD